jgi:hypothetical protein
LAVVQAIHRQRADIEIGRGLLADGIVLADQVFELCALSLKNLRTLGSSANRSKLTEMVARPCGPYLLASSTVCGKLATHVSHLVAQ